LLRLHSRPASRGSPRDTARDLAGPALTGASATDGAPATDLVQGALFVGESHLRRREWFQAARAFARAARLAQERRDSELARGLLHLAAVGYKREVGDERGAGRQLRHALRRLEAFRPVARRLELEELIEVAEPGLGSDY
jgi:hypothetical protein